MKGSTNIRRRLAKVLVPLAVGLSTAAPVATAGTDIGIGIPAGRDSNPAPALPSSAAFQWGDAGIGAGFALGFVTLASGGALVVRRQRGALRPS
jgi:hypothetical protein